MTKDHAHARRPKLRASLACAAIVSMALGWLAPAQPSFAADKVVVTGVLGSYTSGVWPFLIAMKKGFFARHGIKPDVVFVPTAPGLVQQLAAGSLDIVAVNGLAEPLHAVEKGAPVAIMRIIGQTPNYVMIGVPGVKKLSDLKGKKIAIGGLRDINKIFLDRVMAPTGLKDSDYDIIVIGATGARFAALQSGAIDATMLVPPFNFAAVKRGFTSLGLVKDYAQDLPQTGMQASLRWAKANMKEAREINAAVDEAVAWFYNKDNRTEAIDILTEASKGNRDEIAESYDFLSSIDFFAHTSAIHTRPLENMMKDMVALKDMSKIIPTASLVVPGLNELVE
ncbi:MAG: transporter substrate-binding protein [Hyphomicrobiales bacterium]|nr:transporter substrate-binding protein [Hyphomicrobiales bacterium]